MKRYERLWIFVLYMFIIAVLYFALLLCYWMICYWIRNWYMRTVWIVSVMFIFVFSLVLYKLTKDWEDDQVNIFLQLTDIVKLVFWLGLLSFLIFLFFDVQ